MPKTLTVALTGNPNVGKTALFNNLTGARQHVANWPGVTVEKKEGKARLDDYDITVIDLPGTYSLSPVFPGRNHRPELYCGRKTGRGDQCG